MDELIKINKIKGKQNKKKWRKNIDVSGLMDQMEKNDNQQMKAKFQQPLIVEDTTKDARDQLDPNRFKNRLRSEKKKKYDNTYHRQDLIQDGVDDPWSTNQAVIRKNKQQIKIPAIIKPSSGHSYNPTEQHVNQIIEQVIDYEKPRPKKQKKIKKIVERRIVPRARNKKVRQQYLQAIQRRKQKATENQINSMKKIKKQLKEKQQKITKKLTAKSQKLTKEQQQNLLGKVREGRKIGKQRYHYRQYIPKKQQLNKKISNVGLSEQLMRDRYDSIFRRGIIEPRRVKVHANKTKHIKVIEKFRQ